MRVKTAAAIALLAFVIASIAFLVVKESRRSPAGSSASSVPVDAARAAGERAGEASPGLPAGRGKKVVAYYFHGNVRCVSCVKIETLSRKAISEGFSEELASGRVEFRDVNIDEPQNRRFIEEYQLSSQSLVVVEMQEGRRIRWRNLEKVWTLLDSEREFLAYVRSGVSGYLKSG